MNSLDYLKKFENNLSYQKLLDLKEERESLFDRVAATKYRTVLNSLKKYRSSSLDFNSDLVKIGDRAELTDSEFSEIENLCKELVPWRKGPFDLFGIDLDSEWRSDFKWDRLKKSLSSLRGKKILDIGCNNGFFMFKMAQQHPELVLGIDPFMHCCAQFRFLNYFAQLPNLHFELFGVEHVGNFQNFFDVVFSMGIIYHHRNPMQQLLDIRDSMRVGGELILETIGIPGEDSVALYPEDRYSKMRNVWFVPTLSCLINWVKRAKFVDVEVVSIAQTTFEEQRVTPWCPPPHQSLQDFLDPADSSKTIEGYPAPIRFCIKARKS